MRLCVLAIVATCACGARSKPSPPRGFSDAKPDVSIALFDAPDAPPGQGRIEGTVTSVDGERLVEVSAVATSPAFTGERVAVTDDHGAFVHASLPAGEYTMTYFYVRSTFTHRTRVVAGKLTRITITRWHPGEVGELL